MRVSTGCDPVPSSSAGIGHTYFWRLLALVLALAAFNLVFRLDREVVTEWDEALYAISAAETASVTATGSARPSMASSITTTPSRR